MSRRLFLSNSTTDRQTLLDLPPHIKTRDSVFTDNCSSRRKMPASTVPHRLLELCYGGSADHGAVISREESFATQVSSSLGIALFIPLIMMKTFKSSLVGRRRGRISLYCVLGV